MSNLCFVIGLATGIASSPAEPRAFDLPPTRVQFVQGVRGHTVRVSVDGRPARTTFAGKLGFRDQNRSWQSVCADVRSPISNGQLFTLKPSSSRKAGDRIALAGNIVAKYFDSAITADQCAGLQLAVWEAIEDGGSTPNFAAGRFRAAAPAAALDYAEDFYDAIREAKEAAYLEQDGGGQNQLSSLT